MEKITIRTRIPRDAKEIRTLLAGHRITEKRPLLLRGKVSISQTLDGRGYLDWASVGVRKVWHDRSTVVVESTDGQTIRLMNSYETSADGHYADAWWNLKGLYDTVRKMLIR